MLNVDQLTSAHSTIDTSLLPFYFAVEINIRKLHEEGGVTKEHEEYLKEFTSKFFVDIGYAQSFCGIGRRHESRQKHVAESINYLAKAVAILAFEQGGIKIFGQHFNANHSRYKEVSHA